MGHGYACYAACREMGVEESEVPMTASIVSTELTNREMNPRVPTAVEKEKAAAKAAAIAALVPKHLAAIAANIEAESQKRGGNWGQKALSAIRRGKPRSEHQSLAIHLARVEVEASNE